MEIRNEDILFFLVVSALVLAAGEVEGADLNRCRIVEADQLANDSVNESDPPVAPVPPPGEVTACDVLFPDSHPFKLNLGYVAGDLVFFGGIATAIYLVRRRRSS